MLLYEFSQVRLEDNTGSGDLTEKGTGGTNLVRSMVADWGGRKNVQKLIIWFRAWVTGKIELPLRRGRKSREGDELSLGSVSLRS